MLHPRYNLEKDRRWRKIIADWQTSGLTMTEFCRRENIKLSSLCDWRRVIQKRDVEAVTKKNNSKKVKIKKDNPRRSPDNTFVPVVLTGSAIGETPDPVLEIKLRNGAVISVREQCPLNLLASVIKMMEVTHV